MAVYEPTKQTRSVLLFWRQPEEWAEALHAWVTSSVCSIEVRQTDLAL